jgi:arylsulfatase
MRTSGIVWLALLASLTCAIAARASAQQPQPSILFVLAGNIGYGDIGAYGVGELRGSPRPRINQLAAEGLPLTSS